MEKVHVYSWFDPPPCPGEANSGEVVAERQGYVPAHVEIVELLAAGERLAEARGYYEFDADQEVPEDYVDPYRAPDADPVDFGNAVGTLAYMRKKEIEEKKKLDAEKAAADAKAAEEAAKEKFEAAVEAEVSKRSQK